MLHQSSRMQRVADQLQQELALLVQRELRDPRLGFITVSLVRISKDFSFADVYFSVLGKDTEAQAEDSLAALKNASGFLRSALSKKLQLRMVPQLRFHFDDVFVKGHQMGTLISQAIGSAPAAAEGQSGGALGKEAT